MHGGAVWRARRGHGAQAAGAVGSPSDMAEVTSGPVLDPARKAGSARSMTADWSRNSFSSPFSRAFHRAASPADMALPKPRVDTGFDVVFFGSVFSGAEERGCVPGLPVLLETSLTDFLKSRSSAPFALPPAKLLRSAALARDGEFGLVSSWAFADVKQGQSHLGQAIVAGKCLCLQGTHLPARQSTQTTKQ